MNTTNYLTNLTANSEKLITLLDSIPKEKLREKPNGKWSILEIAEHIYLSERTFIRIITQRNDKHHDTEELKGSDRIQKLLVEKRSYKVKAPDFLEPKGRFSSVQEFVTLFSAQRTSLVEKLENGSISDFSAIFPHPFLGELTITDWLYVILHHTSRHTEQINDRLIGQN